MRKDYTVTFREYVGLAGDLQAMLIAETDDGREIRTLFNRSSRFKNFYKWLAMGRLLRKLG